ncbi:hypothetical protein HDN1F_37600 [gamma proteobacterium HdN1]|nr:hypothetical protein HDN1F_37600 [gamma proteobacterium HdN1]
MSSISAKFGPSEAQSNEQFRAAASDALNKTECCSKEALKAALENTPLHTLSKQERTALLTALRQAASDGGVNQEEVETLIQMLKSFTSNDAGYKQSQNALERYSDGGRRFNKDMDKTLNQVGGENADLVKAALKTVNAHYLTHAERSTILTTLKGFIQDGDLSASEAKSLIKMLQDFDDTGKALPPGQFPIQGVCPEKLPGNPICNDIIAKLGCDHTPRECNIGCHPPRNDYHDHNPSRDPGLNQIGMPVIRRNCLHTTDMRPEDTINSAIKSEIYGYLKNCPPSAGRDALIDGFSKTHTRDMSTEQWKDFKMMVMVGSADGNIGCQEARSIYEELLKAPGNRDSSVPPPPRTESASLTTLARP